MKNTSRKPKSQPISDDNWQEAWKYLDSESEVTPREALKHLLRRSGLKPRKMFGQNFLVESDVLESIVSVAELRSEDNVMEVGPGLGVLTLELARRVARVVAVEIDRDLVAALQRVLPPLPNVEIVNADVLAIDPAKYFPDTPYKVVANLPYYITSPTLRHFLEAAHKPTVMVLMVQKEVAERIVAQPGEMSLLSISVQLYGDPRIVRLVPASVFYPVPKVDSAILRVEVYPKPVIDAEPEKLFRVVSAGFAQSRKQLHNSLSRAIWMPPGEAPVILGEAGVDPTRRPQTLSLEEWSRITRLLEQRGYL